MKIKSRLRLNTWFSLGAIVIMPVTIGPYGKITDLNKAIETITGRVRQELIGTDFAN